MTVYIRFDPVILSLEGKPPVPLEWLERAAVAVLEREDFRADLAMTLLVTGDEAIQALNREYLDNDAVTDVLSFPAREDDPESGELYLGDVVISFLQAQRQADAGGNSVEAELQLLVVHGVLHLCGYDHADSDEKDAMWARQVDILEAIGCPLRPD